jgi:hypothetical protein
MTGDPIMSPSPSQPTTLRRPASSDCLVGQERGFRCLPVLPGRPYCAKHDPDQLEARRAQARLAARASHVRRVTPEMETWAESLDFTTEEGRARSLTEVAQLVAKQAISPAEGNAIAALARAATTRVPKVTPPAPLVVEVAKYDRNGHSEPQS